MVRPAVLGRGSKWKLRISPDVPGKWSYSVSSADSRLNGRSGTFEATPSKSRGGLQTAKDAPAHFARQNGDRFWFLGDTAWGYFTDSPEDKHHRPEAENYVNTRAAEGFNVIHCMLMSEQGVGNNNGLPFTSMAEEQINVAYWQEVDHRLAFANSRGVTVGLAVAWGDKRKKEPFAWRIFPDVEARKRFARYIAARYSAYDVYFLVSGEWHGELRTRDKADPETVFREFVEIGSALDAADPHNRMIGIHPMSAHGSVREFTTAPWMSFADYQQNYSDLHAKARLSRYLTGPVVNSEYGYFLRDQNGDGVPDKDNSYTIEDMRYASWDIAMAGAYLVTGFGSTYFAGYRDPGPFHVDKPGNREWGSQAGHLKRFFETLEYWHLTPADEALASKVPRQNDRTWKDGRGRRPPSATYWALAHPGRTYVVYARGTAEPIEVDLGARPREYRIRRFDPRAGTFADVSTETVQGRYTWTPPDVQDWVLVLQSKP
ncbi:MAG TPA: DUF4038 domain-containing protein [Bryobacteraceae bacterium]|nr:DUF4038 domain-containing protein [Bryobacteraceae bacterium]